MRYTSPLNFIRNCIEATTYKPNRRNIVDDRSLQPGFPARQVSHLYILSPDGRYVAWIGGEREAGESLVNITATDTGTTQTLLRVERADAVGLTDILENRLFRQRVC